MISGPLVDRRRILRTLWTHNFDPAIPNSGVFMHTAADAVRRAGIDVDLAYLGNLRTPTGILRARGAVRELARGYDLVHAQYGSACAVASADSHRPLVISLRGSDWTPAYSPSSAWRAHAAAATRMTRHSLPAASVVVVVSRRIGEEVRNRYPTQQVEVLPDPIDISSFRPGLRTESRRRLGLDSAECKRVLFTALDRSRPNKRVELAVAAVENARRVMKDLELVVASGYPHDLMPAVVSTCDVVICTSTAEGWPNSVKEALACGLPFVSTDVSDLRDIARAEPSCKVVAANPVSLGAALVEVLSDDPPVGLEKHVSHMSVDTFAKDLPRVYEEALSLYPWSGFG
jgi:teichuronic acid biosynthesis glycosyltransferase TuaC